MRDKCVRFGVVGVRGFSQRHIEWIGRAVEAGGPLRLAAVATIEDGERETCERLTRDGAVVVREYADLLAMRNGIDVITLPVGIHLHVPLALQALEAGFSVYMEKPVAGTCEQAGILAEAERRAKGRLFVGFQTMYQPSTWELKRRLLAGIVGTVERIVVTVHWPRPASYYGRNAWAGRLEYGGGKIYDCPMQNAAAHFLNTALFLAGRAERDSATPCGVKAELYRANAIDSADSTFSRFSTREGVDVVFNASHCGRNEVPATIDIVGSAGRIEIADHPERVLAPWHEIDADGNSREAGGEIDNPELFAQVANAWLDPDMNEVSTLQTASMHTTANELAFLATGIKQVPATFVKTIPWGENDSLVHVVGMDAALEKMRADGLLPGEANMPWSGPAGTLGRAEADSLLTEAGVRAYSDRL